MTFLRVGLLAALIGAVAMDALPSTVASEQNRTLPNASRGLEVKYGTLYQTCGVDFPGHDKMSVKSNNPDGCPFLCQGAPVLCNTAVWTDHEGGTCWLKDWFGDMKYTENKVGASAFLFMARDVNAFAFKQMDGYDTPGYDIGSVRGSTSDACAQRCVETSKCFAVTWTKHEGGTCWLKGRANAYAPLAGAVSVLVARKGGAFGACPRP